MNHGIRGTRGRKSKGRKRNFKPAVFIQFHAAADRRRSSCEECILNLTNSIFKTSFCLFFPRIPRVLRLEAGTNSAVLEDNFCFSRKMKIEEAFLTWFPAKCKGNTARIKGKKNTLELKIEEPEGATFFVNKLVKECKENAKNGVLSRLAFVAPEISKNTRVRVRMTILQARSF